MPYYRQVGEIPRKRHTQFRTPEGGLYAEELMGVEGFSSDSALLYHRNLPTAIVDAQVVDDHRHAPAPNLPLLPRHFKTPDLTWDDEADAVTGRRVLFGNSDVVIVFVVATAPSPLYRNATGDELLYVQTGSGVVETIYGALTVGDGEAEGLSAAWASARSFSASATVCFACCTCSAPETRSERGSSRSAPASVTSPTVGAVPVRMSP